MRRGTTLLAQVSTCSITAEMTRATAVLVALTASTSVATIIEHAVIPEPGVGAVDGLAGSSNLGPARHDGEMETLARMTASATERGHHVVRRCFRCSHHRAWILVMRSLATGRGPVGQAPCRKNP